MIHFPVNRTKFSGWKSIEMYRAMCHLWHYHRNTTFYFVSNTSSVMELGIYVCKLGIFTPGRLCNKLPTTFLCEVGKVSFEKKFCQLNFSQFGKFDQILNWVMKMTWQIVTRQVSFFFVVVSLNCKFTAYNLHFSNVSILTSNPIPLILTWVPKQPIIIIVPMWSIVVIVDVHQCRSLWLSGLL